jgi:hypothetical protein
MTDTLCRNCKFFDGPDALVNLYPDDEGYCRRHAPVPFLLAIKTGKKPNTEGATATTPNDWFAADWPIVAGHDWCGEFRVLDRIAGIDDD